MLVVHHLGHSQSDRVVWLCEELGIEYELKKYDRSPLLCPPDLAALHPTKAAPVITDGDVLLAETPACVEYIINVHGNGRLAVRPGASNYADYLYWFHFANGSMLPAMGRTFMLQTAGVKADNPIVQRASQKVDGNLAMLDKRVKEVPWLAGEEFTAADVMTVWGLTGWREFNGMDLSSYPNILGYLQRATKREGYRRAMAKGDADIDIEAFIQGPPPPIFPALAQYK